MRIAMLGTRGIPASYGGFETCVEELGARLVARGHEVWVYCRTPHITYPGTHYKGMNLIKLPTIQNKYLDTLPHTFLSTLHVILSPVEIVLMFIAANSPATLLPRLARKKVILHVDGLDWQRAKWPPLAKKYIQWAEYVATVLPNALVTDSPIIQEYYLKKYKKPTTYIPYGTEIYSMPPGQCLQQFGLQPRGYVLFVGRLVPENCVHHLIEAFKGLKTNLKCVIVGDASYEEQYMRELKAMAAPNPNVIFTGYLFGPGYQELSSNAYLFVETSEVGGSHPALIEAMGFGNCVVINDTPYNLQVSGEAGFSYQGALGAASLREQLQQLIDNPALVEAYREEARRRAQEHYSWDKVTDAYEKLFWEVLTE